MKIILFQPQIPQNTGNIVRTCAVTGCDLILIGPLGFSISSRWLKRAGLDYWEGVNVSVTEDFEDLLDKAPAHVYFFSSKAEKSYSEVVYSKDDWLVFGSETSGLPDSIYEKWSKSFVKIPMQPEARCLNLATSVGISVYEALRQQNFKF